MDGGALSVNVIMTCTQAGVMSVYACGLLIVWVRIWYFVVRDGSIFDFSAELIASWTGMVNWCTIVTLGIVYYIPYT